MFKPKNRDELKQAVDLWCNGIFGWVFAWHKYGHISTWDTSLVNDMSSLFLNKKFFNSDISNWDVKNVESFAHMFQGCFMFNQNLNSWNVSNGKFFHCMFSYTFRFNQPLDNWNMENAISITGMFSGCYKFNQSLNNWKFKNLKFMASFFENTHSYNQNIDWNIVEISKKINSDFRNMFGETIGGVSFSVFASNKFTHPIVKEYLRTAKLVIDRETELRLISKINEEIKKLKKK